MPDIFISYAAEDRERIQPLAKALEAQGWSIFWDRQIPAGQTWRSHIGKALGEAKCVIVAWSNTSVTSQWVCEEAEEAKTRGILVPVFLDSVGPPIGFRSIQAADLTEWRQNRSSPSFDHLCDAVRTMTGTSGDRTLTAPPSPPDPGKRRLAAYVALAALVVVGGSLWYSNRKPTSTARPVIDSFMADPQRIARGEHSRLQWSVSGASSVVLEPEQLNVPASGSMEVSPTQTTHYAIKARSSGGETAMTVTVYVDTPGAGPPPVEEEGPVEDCLTFNPGSVALVADGPRWLLTDGTSRMLVFPNREEGRLAERTIKHYKFDRHCFIGRPDPSMEYWLVGREAPAGQMTGEDCVRFNPEGLEIRMMEAGRCFLTDGSSRIMVFPNENEARQAIAIIRKYRFTRTCYIGRPQPSMTYLRR